MSRAITLRADRYGHGERLFTFEADESYCVNCGVTPVWREVGSADYYVGEAYFCVSCRCSFTFQGPDKQDSERESAFMLALVAEVAT